MQLREMGVLLYVSTSPTKTRVKQVRVVKAKIANAKERCMNVLTVIIRQCARTKL